MKQLFKRVSNYVKKSKGARALSTVLVLVLVFGFIISSVPAKKSNSAMDSFNGFVSMESAGLSSSDMIQNSYGSGVNDNYSIKGSYSSDYEVPEAPETSPDSPAEMGGSAHSDSAESKEKLVYSATIGVETKDMEVALERIYAKINEYNGIIQDERQNNMGHITYDTYSYKQSASAYIFVRIPQEHYETFINGIEDVNGDIVVSNISKNVQNMTKVYYDTESRLRSLRVQEERLFEFMQNAKSVSEMLDVEDRLTDVQYEIDSATNSLASIDNDVRYSKVTINIQEVIKYSEKDPNPKNFIERLWSYIEGSADDFIDTLEYWLEGTIYAAPYLLLFVIAFVVIRKIIKKKSKNKTSNEDVE